MLPSEKNKGNEESEEQTTEKDKGNDNSLVFNLPSTPSKSENDTNREIKISGSFHSIPALHSAIKEARCTKSVLFVSHNRFKRALSARTDLSLRQVF